MNDELNRIGAFLLNLILHVMATNGMARIIGYQVMFSACPNHLDFWLEAWFGVQEYKLSTDTLTISWIIELWHGSIYEMGLWLLGEWVRAVKSRVRAITSSWMQQTQVVDGRGKATSLGGVEDRNYEDVYSWRGGIIAKRVKHARIKQKTVNRKRHFFFPVSPSKSLNYYNS